MIPRGTAPAAAGTADAFAQLVRDEQKRVYHFLLKRLGHADDAAELTQETFLHAHRAWASFRGESKASTWLLGIALNLARNHVTRSPSKRWRHLSDDVLDGVASHEPDPERATANRRLVRRLAEAMDALPPDMRDVFSLVCLDGMAYDEAARTLGIPIGTVRSRVARARAALRAAVGGGEEDNGVLEDPARVG
ncbi:RNA polymerase sigma factor [Novispirillum sp. DQ9]|uniref:RNA polymerase sigma factor n=1 Tax=Novispirillum sp. DQ9 TaxID=3398612 RepID=UPI003C7C5FDE